MSFVFNEKSGRWGPAPKAKEEKPLDYESGKRPALKRYQIIMPDSTDGSLGRIKVDRESIEHPARDRDAQELRLLAHEFEEHGFSVDDDPFNRAVKNYWGNPYGRAFWAVHHFLAGRKGMWHRWNKSSGEYSTVFYSEPALAFFWHWVKPNLEKLGCIVVAAKMKDSDTPWQGEMPAYTGDQCMPQRKSAVPLEEWEASLPPEKLEIWKKLRSVGP